MFLSAICRSDVSIFTSHLPWLRRHRLAYVFRILNRQFCQDSIQDFQLFVLHLMIALCRPPIEEPQHEFKSPKAHDDCNGFPHDAHVIHTATTVKEGGRTGHDSWSRISVLCSFTGHPAPFPVLGAQNCRDAWARKLGIYHPVCNRTLKQTHRDLPGFREDCLRKESDLPVFGLEPLEQFRPRYRIRRLAPDDPTSNDVIGVHAQYLFSKTTRMPSW